MLEHQNTAPRQGVGLGTQNPVQAMFASFTKNQKRKFLAEQENRNRLLPAHMSPTVLPEDMVGYVVGAWQSREFSAIAWPCNVHGVACRLSINRMRLDPETGSWLGGISWDDLYRIKNECGFADLDAVEVYPAEDKLVNVSNMRHLWVMETRLPFTLS